MLEFIERLFGKNEDGTPKAMTYDELEAAVLADKNIKAVDLSAGGYVSQEKFNAKDTELSGVKQQLNDANAQIQSYQDMDIEGIKKSAADWEQKYKDDTAALNSRLSEQERSFAMDRFLDGYKFTSPFARKGVLDEFKAKDFKLEDGKFLGGEEYMKGLMENEAYEGTFVPEEVEKEPEPQPQENKYQPYFSQGSGSQSKELKSNPFEFGFTGVRRRPQ